MTIKIKGKNRRQRGEKMLMSDDNLGFSFD